MPFVHIELIKGRSDEQITNLMKDVTEAVHKNTGAPKEHIHVIINELGNAKCVIDMKGVEFISRSLLMNCLKFARSLFL